jgi:hypothetical protein
MGTQKQRWKEISGNLEVVRGILLRGAVVQLKEKKMTQESRKEQTKTNREKPDLIELPE